MSDNALPLAGVKVVELSTFIAASTTGRFFANMGADVIKVESGKGDPERNGAVGEGISPDPLENTSFELENGNKRGLALNLKSEEGMKAFFRLLATADVFITNNRKQSLVKMGIDYDSLKEKFPKLVYGMVTGFGEYGPVKDVPGFDFTAFFSRGGYVNTMRQKDGDVFNMVPGLGDHNVGLNLAAGIMAALYKAKATGVGDKVECSLYETAVFNMSMNLCAVQYPEYGMHYPINNYESQNPCNTAFRTKDDKYIQVCFPQYNMFFERYITAIGRPDLINDKYFPQENLLKNGLTRDLYDQMCEAFKKLTADEAVERLTKADVPFSRCFSLEEIVDDEQAWANKCFYKFKFRNGNEKSLVEQPIRLGSIDDFDHRRAPDIGENTREILSEIGYADDDIDAMLEKGEAYFIPKEVK